MNKRYETDSYLREWTTTVTSCIREGDRIYLQLAETIFFPEEGGQHADTGVLMPVTHETSAECVPGDGNAPESSAQIPEAFAPASPEYPSETNPSAAAVHILDGEYRRGDIRYLVDADLPVGTEVHCILDWTQRYSRMQQHTGEHILTGVIHNRFGYTNVGFHLSDDGPVTLDLNGPLTYEQAMEMEQAANEVVYANLPVKDLYPTREMLADLDYRSKIEIEGQVRLIAVGMQDGIATPPSDTSQGHAADPGAFPRFDSLPSESAVPAARGGQPCAQLAAFASISFLFPLRPDGLVDLCACCAPHVKHTGEVGIIKIVSLQNYKGGVRLGILCGGRALAHYRGEWHRLTSLANALSTGVDQVEGTVSSLRQELAEAKQRIAGLMESAILREIEAIPADAPAVYFTSENLSPVVVKNVFNAMTARFPGYIGLFIGNDTDGYRYAAGSATLDARELAKAMREKLAAKGGGSREMIQGKVMATRETILEFWLAR